MDRREALAAAFDKVETEEKVEIPQKEESVETPKEEIVAKEETPVKEEKEPEVRWQTPKTEAKKEEKPETKDPDGDQERAAAAALAKVGRAPAGWKPAAKEHWAALPPEVREMVATRERQIQEKLTETETTRKWANDFANVIAPHQHLIRAQNSTPLQAIDNLMRTAAGLMQGSSDQKASIVAEIIENYGIDIKVLDNVLSKRMQNGGHSSAARPMHEAPPAWARPMFDFMQQAQNAQQAHNRQMQSEAASQVEEMMGEPFFEDLREEIADIMEVAANRGRKMTLKEGYTRALALNPEISKIMNQRAEAAKANGGDGSLSAAARQLAAAKKAKTVIKGAPAGEGGKPQPKTRREALEQAFDNLS